MNEHERNTMNEQDFEIMLEHSVPAEPPDDVACQVTPWKKAMNQILTGTALTILTFNFWCLNYILPTIGMILLLLGFRSMRHENKWFGGCYLLLILRAAYYFPLLILNTTILRSAVYASPVSPALTAVNLTLVMMGLVCLWRGLIAVQRKAGLPPHAGGAPALMVWYACMILLTLIQYSGWLIVGAMVVIYVLILRSLLRLSGELDEAGYAVHAAPIRVTDRFVVISLLSLLLVGFICGYTFGGSYPMKWRAFDTAGHTEVAHIKSHLLRLGFPENVLDDISAEDIAACEGALQVVVDVSDKPVNDGRRVTTKYKNGEHQYIFQDTAYDVSELRITSVGVQIPGEREQWIIFHHFFWTVDPGFYGTEALQLWPVYRDISEGWRSSGKVTGHVLYDKNGETFAADYYFLGEQTFTANSIFGGNQSSTDTFAAFSMPRNSERQRGYIAYPAEEVQDGYIISSWVNYTHQRSWLQYPAVTAMESRMTNVWNDAGAFQTVQTALQFYPAEEDAELIH